MFGGKVGKENQQVKCRRRCRANYYVCFGALQEEGYRVE